MVKSHSIIRSETKSAETNNDDIGSDVERPDKTYKTVRVRCLSEESIDEFEVDEDGLEVDKDEGLQKVCATLTARKNTTQTASTGSSTASQIETGTCHARARV